ncbi:MAG: ABC transporter substrate-binding protein [Vulcanimicrobiaceae bacterium]
MRRIFAAVLVAVVSCLASPAARAAGNHALRVGSDISYAPLEFYAQGSRRARGFDLDLIQAVAGKMGRPLTIVNHDFSTLLSAVQQGRLDLGISAITDTRARERQVNFVDYLLVGTGMLVPRGNPHHVFNLGGLCGLTVDLQAGTSQQAAVRAQSKECRSVGLAPVHILAFPTDVAAFKAFAAGRSDVHLSDYPVVAYLALTVGHGKRYEVVGRQFSVAPYGIAVAKNRPALLAAVRRALQGVIADGTYDRLLKKWGLVQAALRSAPINAGPLFER